MDKRIPPQPARPAARRPRTLGPVADLEHHLPGEWWRELFDSLYLRTDGDVVENDLNTIAEIDLLVQSTGIGPGDRLLDLCCGQGRHAIELARRGFKDVTGIFHIEIAEGIAHHEERLALQRGPMEKAAEPGQADQPPGRAAVTDTLSL
ncbi:MAG: SAM-dependent methyltransferase [Gammaproteobacteria bacterium]